MPTFAENYRAADLTFDDNGKLSLRDKGIVPVLVEAIKELKAEIQELKNCKCENCNCK